LTIDYCLQVVVGKGGPWLLPFLLKAFDLDPSRTAIVGDRLDTDVALGLEGGLQTFLPLTGVTTRDELQAADEQIAPHFVLPSVSVLAGL
jgi:ribonucleotide monophosphatase NagD (HAD superfamily)